MKWIPQLPYQSTIRIAVLALLGMVFPNPSDARNAPLSDGVVNLSESLSIEAPGRADKRPEVLVVGNVVHTFWFKARAEGGHAVCYRRSLDRGDTWEPTYEYYQNDLEIRDVVVSSVDKHLAVENGRVHLVFGAYGGEGGGWYGELVYLRSVNDGASFDDPRILWSSGGDGPSSPWHAYNPRVIGSGDRLAICYRRQANWYNHLSAHVLTSTDGGSSFLDVEAASGGEGGSWSIEDFHSKGDQIAMLYKQSAASFGLTKGDLYLSVSTDGGQSFKQTKISVPSSNGVDKVHPSHDEHYSATIGGAESKVFATWKGLDAEDQPHIFLRRSVDGGSTFGEAMNLTKNTILVPDQLTSQHTIAAIGRYVYVLIHTSTSKLYLIRSTDSGTTFGPVIEVTDPLGSSYAADAWWPVMNLKSNGPDLPPTIHITCAGLKTFTSTDNGVSFIVRSFPTPIWSMREGHRPQMVIDEQGSLHGVCEGSWTFYETGVFGDPDILYSRLDPIPIAGVLEPLAIQLDTVKNKGDGTGHERYDAVYIPGDKDTFPSQAFTLECWVKTDRINPNADAYFIEKQGPPKGGSWESLLLGQWRNGQADARLTTENDGYVLVGGPELLPNEWHHLAVTFDYQADGENFILYVDGKREGAVRAEGLLETGRGPLFLGGSKDLRTDGSVTLDEVRIWNTALDEKTIASRQDRALNGTEPGLIAWYPLDHTTRDLSGKGNHGVLLYQGNFVTGKLSSVLPPDEEELFYNGNAGAVLSGPIASTLVTFDAQVRITRVTNYHSFNAGQQPGTISLKGEDGITYGPWQATGRAGQGGVPDAYWDAAASTTLDAGTYTVIDSRPATWSYNSQSGGAGITWIYGYVVGPPTFDDWMVSHGVPADQAAEEDDPNGDGVSNIAAYYAGLSPMLSGLGSLPNIALSADGEITMNFPRASGVRDVTASVEISTNGIDWATGPAPTVVRQEGPAEMLSSDLSGLTERFTLARVRYQRTP